jgi:hypothetical protein
MPFRLRIDPIAQANIDEFARYLRDYSDRIADEQLGRLDRVLLRRRSSAVELFCFDGRRIGPTCFGSAVALNIGLFTQSMRKSEL